MPRPLGVLPSGSLGKEEPNRSVVVDEGGRVRVYMEDGGGEESITVARIFYDQEGHHRLVFVQIRSFHFGASEQLMAFDADGKAMASKEGLVDDAELARWAKRARASDVLATGCPTPCPPCPGG